MLAINVKIVIRVVAASNDMSGNWSCSTVLAGLVISGLEVMAKMM